MIRKLFSKYRALKQSMVTIRWEYPWAEEEEYLASLNHTSINVENGFESSQLQYKAQVFKLPLIKIFFLQLFSFGSIFFILIKGIGSRLNNNRKKGLADVAYFYSDKIFPKSLKSNRKMIYVNNSSVSLSFSDILFLIRTAIVIRFNMVILAAAMYRIGQISYAKKIYCVSEVWVNMEYSCASGIAYEYCKRSNLLIKNFMHGEKVLSLRDSFAHFHEIYVWDEHYAKIFTRLHARGKIFINKPWNENKKKNGGANQNTLCYFFKGAETEVESETISSLIEKFESLGYRIFIKKHPRQKNTLFLNKDYDEVLDFDNEISLLYKFDYIVAQYSTVLFQCWCNNQAVLIDDISNRYLVNSLVDREYFFYHNPIQDNSKLLSTFLYEKNN